MIRRLGIVVSSGVAASLLVAVLSASALAAPKKARPAAEVIPDQYIVVYRNAVKDVKGETKRLEGAAGFRATHRYASALKGFSAKLSSRQLEALRNDPDVAFISPDRPVAALDSVPLSSGDEAPTGVRRIEAATTTTAREASPVNVAVIDTGIDLNNPDLNAVAGKNCVSTQTPPPPPSDDNGHGTHVSGTIAAENNGSRAVGVAPGTKLYAVKVLNSSGSGSWSQVICGINWVTGTRTDGDPSNDIAVASMSLGGAGPALQSCPTTNDTLHNAICNSTANGVTYVVAAGNSGGPFDSTTSPNTPAAYPEVLTVTAVSDSDGSGGGTGGAPTCRSGEVDDQYASFSNYAATAAGQAHTIAGPGVCIRSDTPGGAYPTIMSGTSMATPHMTGAVALCIAEGNAVGPCSGLSPAQIIQQMRSTAEAHTTSTPDYGFTGDPLHNPVSGRYYGYLGWTGTPEPPGPDLTPPSVSSVSPGDGATGVATTAAVSATFSEPMDSTATEAAFSLVDSATSNGVAGTFSWSGNTMTFRPSSALANSTNYTARISTGATDAAGNTLASDRVWSFTTAAAVVTSTASPSSTTIQYGSLRSGSYANLAADDNVYLQVNSNSSSTRQATWYGTIKGVANSLKSLSVLYRGKNSATATQTVSLYRWTTSSWVQIDSRSVGTTELLVQKSPTGTLADYVSGSSGDGDVRVRIKCTRSSGTFYTSADQLNATFTK